MQVQFPNFKPSFTVNNRKQNLLINNNSNPIITNNISNDTFVKSSTISFKGKEESKLSKIKKNVVDALPVVAFVGAPILFTIGSTVALTRMQNPEQIFLSDGTYFADASELRGPNDNIVVDTMTDTFKMKAGGIDIDPSRFTNIDSENGIYENPAKGIYINLSSDNFKYVDPENGIFMDAAKGISAATNEHGLLEEIIVPNFDVSFGSGMPAVLPHSAGGGSVSSHWRRYPKYDRDAVSREDFIKEHGTSPEEYYTGNRGEDIDTGFNGGHVKPNDYRNVFQKIRDYFVPQGDQSQFGYDTSKTYDIFSRRIVDIKDGGGEIHRLALTDDVENLIHAEKIDDDSFVKIIEFANDHKLANYISHYHPSYEGFLSNDTKTFEEFFNGLKDSDNDTNLDTEIIDNSQDALEIDNDDESPLEKAATILANLLSDEE